ncbi:hypothetical protein ILUMI_18439 [Ignelater luminosus]|uniref:Odorant receptor n=1 Tax=Ignelater luminosus TaxID=2038154 RepID=A0A8K0CJW8_IGNLU|nr:hypothetical protein ILUMI_18439 [Ignelater luminosus]
MSDQEEVLRCDKSIGIRDVAKDRVFGRIERVSNKKECIVDPAEYLTMFSKHGELTQLQDIGVVNWKTPASQGESHYNTDLGVPKGILKRGRRLQDVSLEGINPDEVPPKEKKLMVKSNSADAFRIQHDMLMLTGMWPIENPNGSYRIKTLLSWVSALGLSGVMLTQLIHDITDFTKLSETLYILITYIRFTFKLLVFKYSREEFLNVINFLKNPIFLSYPEDLDHYIAKSINQSVRLAKIFQPFMVNLLICNAVYPILDNTSLPFSFPYGLGKYRMIMYCSQLISEGISAVNNIYIDTTCTTLMGIVPTQLDILTERLMRLKENDGTVEDHAISNEVSESINEKLKDCVKHHLVIIK